MDDFLFDGLDIAGAEDLAAGVPDGTYANAVISGNEVWTSKDGERKALKISYSVPGYDLPVTEFKTIPLGRPSSWDRTIQDKDGKTEFDRKQNDLKYLKARLKNLGVPETRMNSLRPGDLEGIQVVLTVVRQKNNPTYPAVGRVEVKNSAPATATLAKPSFAPVVTSTTGPDTIIHATGVPDTANPFA